MATNKNQHFVPRCHLRPFTNDEEGKSIRLFNIDRERLVNKAAVKHQCSGSYFYGDDEKLETAIQFMEQSYADTLRRVRDPSYDELTQRDELVFKKFWLFQHLRTEAASRRAVEMTSQVGQLVGADSFGLQIQDAVLMAMETFSEEMNAVDDLRGCLIKNSSRLPFITSDDPAVFTNRWFKNDPRHRGSAFGLRSAGILAILPLSLNMSFVAYDPDVYSVSKNKGISKVRAVADISALNQLQLLNCRANIFPGPNYNVQQLVKELRSCRENRLESRHALHYAVLDKEEGEYKRYRVVDHPDEEDHREALLHSQMLFPTPMKWPRFLKWRRKGFGMVNGTGLGCIRQSKIEQRHSQPFHKMWTRL